MKRNLPSLITTALLFFCMSTGYTQNFWEPLGAPSGVNILSLATTADGTIFIGTYYNSDGKGIYRLIPGNTNWEFVGPLENSTIYGLEVTPTGEIFAGASGTIFKSVDNGNTWYPVYVGEVANWVAIKAFGNGLVFAGSASGSPHNSVLRSLDNGETWDTVFQLSGSEPIGDFARAPDSTIYTCTTHYFNGGGVYRSIDNGSNWEYIGLSNDWLLSIAVNSAGEVFAGGYSGIYKYTGNGTSWILLKDYLDVEKLFINTIGVIFASCNNSSFNNGGVLRSENNGQSFEYINSGLETNATETFDMDGAGCIYTSSNYPTCVYRSIETTIPSPLNGVITYPNTVGTPLSNVHINLLQQDTLIMETNTNAHGYYQFNNINNGVFTMLPSTTKLWDGVTASDVLLYRKHIANISSLSGIYLASGDVNASGELTATDVLLIKKRIANVISAFPAGDWLFNCTTVTIPNTNTTVTENFNGMIYGDANGSYVPTAK